jgi:hypothetical protein
MDGRRAAEAIFIRRERMFAASIGMLIGLAVTVLLSFLVPMGFVDYDGSPDWHPVSPFEKLPSVLALTAVLVPLVAMRFGAISRRRLLRTIEARRGDDGPPPELCAQLHTVALAESRERRSYSLMMGTMLAYAPAVVLGSLSLADGFEARILGKALYKVCTLGWPLMIAMFFAGALHMRRLTGKDRGKASVWTASAVPFMVYGTAIATMIAWVYGLAEEWTVATVVFAGCAAAIVAVPAFWWSTRRLRKERAELSKIALPSRLEDSDEVRSLLERTLSWADGPSAVRIDALKGLAQRLTPDALAPHLDRCFADREVAVVHAALRIAIEKRHKAPLERLLALGECLDDTTHALLPPMLRRHKDERVEKALLDLLARDADEVKSAAAEALGLVGSIGCVESLRRESQRSTSRRVVDACTEAIERIHIRAKGGRGQLALLEEAEGGSLSYVEKEPGSVSLR